MFVLMKAVDGRRLLVNLDQMFCVQEDDKGGAVAVSISGAAVPTGETFDFVLHEFMGEEPPK